MRGSKESLGQTNYPFVLSLLLQCLQCKKEENLESCCFPPESQQCRDVGPSRDLGLREGNGGGLVLLQADEEDHQDLRDEDRQPGQRHHSHRRPGLRFRLLRIRLKKSHTIHAVAVLIVFFCSFNEEIRGADPSAAGGSRVRDDPEAQGGAREAGTPDAGFLYKSAFGVSTETHFSRLSLCPSVSLKQSLALSLSWTSTGRGRQRWQS